MNGCSLERGADMKMMCFMMFHVSLCGSGVAEGAVRGLVKRGQTIRRFLPRFEVAQ